ncbi:MAG: 2'-deoxycytidine 5'-triphosphate deaminase [Kiloniellales bacterium]
MADTLFPDLERQLGGSVSTGILPDRALVQLIESGLISAAEPVGTGQVQPASLDLRLGPIAYRVRASFLPGANHSVRQRMESLVMHEVDLTRPTVLEKGCVYIVPLMEELNLPGRLSARANPKSTIGRIDVFARLITDYASTFEEIPAGFKGKLYLEISPRTFSILVRQGDRLNQLRVVKGSPLPSDAALERLHERDGLVVSSDDQETEAVIRKKSLWISIDLEGQGTAEIVGYRAKQHSPILDLARIAHYDPLDFWEPIPARTRNLILNPDDFYILVSREKLRVPPDYAAEMVAYDTAVGEFRAHYAGFFDPGFGYGGGEIQGTRAVLEVRSHEVPFLLEDGQIIGRLIYERMAEPPERLYGSDIGSSYQGQGLALSKQFAPLDRATIR